MIKLYQSLCTIFSARAEGNGTINNLMRVRALQGRIDEPKKIAILTELLNRVADLEERIADLETVTSRSTFKSELQSVITNSEIATESVKKALEIDPDLNLQVNMSWSDLRRKATELGVFKIGASREQLETLIASKSTS